MLSSVIRLSRSGTSGALSSSSPRSSIFQSRNAVSNVLPRIAIAISVLNDLESRGLTSPLPGDGLSRGTRRWATFIVKRPSIS